MASFVQKISGKVGEVRGQVAGSSAGCNAAASVTSVNEDSSKIITDGIAGVSLEGKKKGKFSLLSTSQ